MGRRRGGGGTKLHRAAADERTAVAVCRTPGQPGDAPVCDDLLGAVPAAVGVEHGVADQGYDSDALRPALRDRGIVAVIPSHARRRAPLPYEARRYRERNRVERRVGQRKQFRRVATRYEKLDVTSWALIHLVAAFVKFR